MDAMYKKFLDSWRFVHDLNRSDIFCYGEAVITDDGDYKVLFDDAATQAAYRDKFGF